MSAPVRVELGPNAYDVTIAPGALEGLGAAAAAMRARSAVVVSDSNVAPLYARAAEKSLVSAGVAANTIVFEAGERNKTLGTLGRLYDELFAIRPAVDRQTLVAPVGGGVACDLGGLLAATALRGLRWLPCPTSLLADVDASVGGKTGVDHAAGKNLIGAFHQPAGVIIDTRALATLPGAELLSGLAECVKHAVIRDAGLLDFIEGASERLRACDEQAMTELVRWNVAIKAGVVAGDEREAGERAHLNFGHTIGHAIETFAGYGALTHGQAVALGMVAACGIAADRGLLDAASARRVKSVLERLGLATSMAGLDAPELWRIMQHDKKARGGKVRMVLPVRIGAVTMVDDLTQAEASRAIEGLRQ